MLFRLGVMNVPFLSGNNIVVYSSCGGGMGGGTWWTAGCGTPKAGSIVLA